MRLSDPASRFRYCVIGIFAILTLPPSPARANNLLSLRVTCDFEQTPLSDAVNQLAASAEIPFVVDQRALQAASVDSKKLLVSYSARSRPLSTALKELLASHHLEWVIRHDVVVITTSKAARTEYYQTVAYRITRRIPAERRLRSIMWSIEPDSWVVSGGKADAAAVTDKLLLIHQSASHQREITRRFASSVVPVHDREPAEANSSPLQRRLDTAIELDLPALSISELCGRLEDAAAIELEVDLEALEAADIDVSRVIGPLRATRDCQLSTAFSLLTDAISPKAAWLVAGDKIAITSREAASEQLTPAEYNVRVIVRDSDIHQLVDAIQYTVAADSWFDVGGDGTISETRDGVLKIEQSRPVHRTLRRLLTQLRAAAIAEPTKD